METSPATASQYDESAIEDLTLVELCAGKFKANVALTVDEASNRRRVVAIKGSYATERNAAKAARKYIINHYPHLVDPHYWD